jgi:hypothetical protein
MKYFNEEYLTDLMAAVIFAVGVGVFVWWVLR